MNRRNFLRSLGLGVAAVYLRLAPEKVLAVPVGYHTAQEFMASGIIHLPYTPIYVTRDLRVTDCGNKPAPGWFARRSLF